MAETDPKIMSLVEAALEKDPGASVEALFDMAKKSSRAVGKMSLRQFHARYPLQIKRRKNKAAKAAGKAPAKAASAKSGRRKAASKAPARKASASKRSARKTSARKAAPKAAARKAAPRKAKAAKAAPKKAAARAKAAPRKAAAARPAAASNGAAIGGRDGLRAVFLGFAADLAAAEGRKDAVKVVANVDRYVDRAIKALR